MFYRSTQDDLQLILRGKATFLVILLRSIFSEVTLATSWDYIYIIYFFNVPETSRTLIQSVRIWSKWITVIFILFSDGNRAIPNYISTLFFF